MHVRHFATISIIHYNKGSDLPEFEFAAGKSRKVNSAGIYF